MTIENYTKPVVFVTNADVKGIGIFVSNDNTFVVEVFRDEGKATYSYKLNGRKQFMTRLTPFEAWELISSHLGANLVKVSSKWLKKTYKEELKIYKGDK